MRTVIPVLSIGKLAVGQQEYYLRTVAAGVEDYYLGSGEAEGRWIGDAAGTLDVVGTVVRERLAAVLDGRHPTTGEALSGSHDANCPVGI